MDTSRISTRHLTLIACFTAILSILAQITIPLPTGVPLTMQTFGIALGGYVLGRKKGLLSTFLYLLCGAVGLPVFAGFQGGLASFFGKTGGFLFGFLLLAFCCGIAGEKKNKLVQGAYGVLGMLLCHLLGVLQFAFLMKMSFIATFLLVSLPFLVKDLLSIGFAFLIGELVKKALAQSGMEI